MSENTVIDDRSLFIKVVDWYVYGNFHISFAVFCFTLFHFLNYDVVPDWYYISFVGLGTFFIYTLHKLYGLRKVNKSLNHRRFIIATHYWNHLLIYFLIGGLAAAYCYFNLSHTEKLCIILPSILSLGYVVPLPLFGSRFRDLPFLKILLVGLSYSLLCSTIPLLNHSDIVLASVHAFCFIVGISLPFDIRDLSIDDVKTIPAAIGKNKATLLAMGLVGLSMVMSMVSLQLNLFIALVYLPTLILIYFGRSIKNDYFYSFALDGTMMFPLLAYLISY